MSLLFYKENFIRLEKKLELFNLEIQNVKIWQYIRYKIYHQILNESTDFNKAQDDIDRSILSSIKKFLNALILIFKNKDALFN